MRFSFSLSACIWASNPEPRRTPGVFCVPVRLEFKEEVLRKKYEEETGSLAEERARQEAQEHQILMAWNDAENLRMLKLR